LTKFVAVITQFLCVLHDHTYIYIYIICTLLCTCVLLTISYVDACTHMYVCVYIYIHIYYVHCSLRKRELYGCICVCVCIHTYIHTYIHTTYINSHIHAWNPGLVSHIVSYNGHSSFIGHKRRIHTYIYCIHTYIYTWTPNLVAPPVLTIVIAAAALLDIGKGFIHTYTTYACIYNPNLVVPSIRLNDRHSSFFGHKYRVHTLHMYTYIAEPGGAIRLDHRHSSVIGHQNRIQIGNRRCVRHIASHTAYIPNLSPCKPLHLVHHGLHPSIHPCMYVCVILCQVCSGSESVRTIPATNGLHVFVWFYLV
jgi:hypothetical protein